MMVGDTVAPRPEGLGKLSAKYESARQGARAIGWDSAGGASYGTYQIATKTGTMNHFLDWCREHYPNLWNALNPLASSMFDRHGPFAEKWIQLANSALVQPAEHEFIAQTHFDIAYGKLTEPVRELVSNSRALQDVLWSTAVQHGPNGAAYIFNASWSEELAPRQYIPRIYERRGRRLGHLTPEVRQAVLNRYAHEQADALRMTEGPG